MKFELKTIPPKCPFDQGKQAVLDGLNGSHNPYPKNTPEAMLWLRGYFAEKADLPCPKSKPSSRGAAPVSPVRA